MPCKQFDALNSKKKSIAFIRLRQNTLQLAAGMNGGANAPKLEQRPSSAVALLRRMERRVGFSEFPFDTPQLAAGRFIVLGVKSRGRYVVVVLFFAPEVAEEAVEKEKKRKGFYARLTELSTNQYMRELFQFLTEKEGGHIAAFAQIRDNLSEETHSVEYTADTEAYMDSVLDNRL
jgi:hypothetical protein